MSESPRAGKGAVRPLPSTAPEPPPERRRRADSLATDELILDAAMASVLKGGADALSMRQVAERAGLKSPSGLYSRYENPAELAVALWEARCAPAMHDFLAAAVSNGGSDDGELVAQIVQSVTYPAPAVAAGVELMSIARRTDELGEVIAPQIIHWMEGWKAGAAASRQHRAVGMGGAVFAVGVILSERPAEVPRSDWSFHLRWQSGAELEPFTSQGAVRALPQPAMRLVIEDPVRASLVSATAAVVARSGYERATAQRVARRAGFSTGAVYSRYEDREALMADAVEQILGATFRAGMDRNGELIRAGTFVEESGAIMAGHVGPAARDVGRLMVEMHLAAAHHRTVGRALAAAHHQTITEDLAQLGQTDERFALLPRGTRAMRLGLYVFDDLLAEFGGLTDVDWRPFIVPQAHRALTDPDLWNPTGQPS